MSSLSREELLEMLSMRYALSLQSFQKYLAVTVAKDVSNESAAEIMERRDELSGVNIQEDSIRVYEGGEACAPILGYTGKISSEELEEMDGGELAGGGYTLNSVVGKSGMEQYLEKELQGTDGKPVKYLPASAIRDMIITGWQTRWTMTIITGFITMPRCRSITGRRSSCPRRVPRSSRSWKCHKRGGSASEFMQ